MWYVVACRACLATEGKFQKFTPASRRTFMTLTGLEIQDGDGFPTHLCGECYTQIKKATLFRKRSRRAHFVLKEIMAVKKQITLKDIQTVDRKKTNLVSPYTYWKPENSIAYSFTINDLDVTDNENTHTKIEEIVNISMPIATNDTSLHAEDTSITKQSVNAIAADIWKDWSPIDLNKDVNRDDNTARNVTTYNYKLNYIQETNDEVHEVKIQRDSDEKLEINSELLNTKGNFIKHKLETIHSSSIVVNIKPENYKEIERLEEEERQKQKELEAPDDDFQMYDNTEVGAIDVVKEEIDLEDVFKGLKEEESESEEEPDIPWPEVDVKKEPKKSALNWKPDSKCIKAAHALGHCTRIRLMTSEEQVEAFQRMMLEEPMKSARFKCILCVTISPDMASLMRHVQYHNRKIQSGIPCPICKDYFKNEEWLKKHQAEKHWYEYTCGKCDQKHYTLSDLVACHATCPRFNNGPRKPKIDNQWTLKALPPELYPVTVQSKSRANTPHRCHLCGDCFLNAANLVKHMGKHETPNRSHYQCDICKLYMRQKQALERHMEHYHLYSYICDVCGACLINRKQAMDHMVTHPKPGLSYPCSSCNKTFSTAAKVHYHEQTMHSVDCNLCGQNLGSSELYYKHQLTNHGYVILNTEAEMNDPQYYCSHCNMYFMSEKILFKHLARSGHEEAKSYELGCIACKELFDNEEDFTRHRLCCRTNVFPKDCVYCDAVLKDVMEYKKHYFKVHPDFPYQHITARRLCEICGKAVYLNNTTQHMRTHDSNELALKCKFCPVTSTSALQHVSHVLCNHTLKPYCCLICGMRFTNRCDCRDHILKSHAPVRPYKCEACSREFAHLDYLHDHCLKLHRINLKKTNKSLFLRRKNPGSMLVFPDMQIDGSLLDVELLEKIKIESCDYMEQNRKVIRYSDCFFFDPTVDPSVPTRQPNPRYRLEQDRLSFKIEKAAKKEKLKKKKMKVKVSQEKNKKGKKKREPGVIKEENISMGLVITESDDGREETSEGLPTVEEVIDNMEANEEAMRVDETEDVGELVERDGEYYALVNGELFKIDAPQE